MKVNLSNFSESNFFARTLEINRLLEEVKRDKAKLEGQCKDLTSDLKNKVMQDLLLGQGRSQSSVGTCIENSNLNFERLLKTKTMFQVLNVKF